MMRNVRFAPLVQGTFYVATGLWPLLHFRSFEAITGKKKEPWLVKTMGGLIAAVGVALLSAARERDRTSPKMLGIASALVLGGADIVFVRQRQIPRVYLFDAIAEAALIATWLVME